MVKFGRGMNYDGVRDDLEGQGHRSKVMVVRSINMIFQQFVLTMHVYSQYH